MKRIKSKSIRISVILIITALLFIGLVILFISPLTKYWLEKNDVNYIGREIKMDWVYVNPFTGYIHIKNLKIYEIKSDTLFFSTDRVSIDLSLRKLLSHEIVITSVKITNPWIQIIQKKKQSNYDDFIKRFSRDTTQASPSNWHFSILQTTVANGEIHYREKAIPINYFIRNVNIESSGKKWNIDTVFTTFSFKDGKKDGTVSGNATFNVTNQNYRTAFNVLNYDLEIIRQYFWELINYGMFRSKIDANLQATGNLKNQQNLTAIGRIALRDFHFGKTKTDDYFAFKKAVMVIKELSPQKKVYQFDSIVLTKPYLKFERYDSLDNLQAIFGKKGKNITDVTQQPGRFNLVIEIARYVKTLSKNFLNSDYKIGRVSIDSGNFVFNDFSLNEKFSVQANPLTITADSVNKSKKRVAITMHSAFIPFGSSNFFLSVNPKDTSDFDLNYSLEKIPVSIFNPYLISYTSFPLDRGTIELHGKWNVRNGEINSTNHIVIIDPRVTQKIRNRDNHWLPMPLIMALIRERGNVIDYEIPITGNLKKPSFHLRDVIFDLIKNIFVKPPTTPYRLEVKSNETEIEKSLTVKWEMMQRNLTKNQLKFVKMISGFLSKNPTEKITVHSILFTEKEKEYILFFETKKKYFLQTHKKNENIFTQDDSLAVARMSIREDKVFLKFLGKGLQDTVMFTLQEKCLNYVGSKVIENHFNSLKKERERSFMSVFIKDKTNANIQTVEQLSTRPYNGFSYYKISYPKDIPIELQQAFMKMNELNDENPRKKYRKQRQRNKQGYSFIQDKPIIIGNSNHWTYFYADVRRYLTLGSKKRSILAL